MHTNFFNCEIKFWANLISLYKLFFNLFHISALPTSLSCVFSSILCLITFAGMQLFKTQLGSGKMMTIVGGFLGSQVFVFALTVSFHNVFIFCVYFDHLFC